jgi:hypothetical protein
MDSQFVQKIRPPPFKSLSIPLMSSQYNSIFIRGTMKAGAAAIRSLTK